MPEYTRRQMVSATAGVAALGATAGCLGGLVSSESNETAAQASFFVFGDFASKVAGEAAATETLVPVGQHGHGWEPGARVREDIRAATLFLHGMESFQPWADDILADLEDDDADVTPVDVSTDVHLLEAGSEHDHRDEHEETVDEHHDGHEGTVDEHHDGHEGTVDEHHDGHEETVDEHHDGHGHGEGADPHFWMDPVRSMEALTTIEGALADAYGENADTFETNAAAYRDELQSLHERLQSIRAEASTDVLLVAGHDAFQYLGDQYGLKIEALTDVSPDDRPTVRDIERAQDVIKTHDIQYICADPLESQQAAEQLVAETDAEAVLPLTAMPGRTDEWAANDWGYVEVMENVNVPTLAQALGAE
jgi:zinc transport system substrate-binding protein